MLTKIIKWIMNLKLPSLCSLGMHSGKWDKANQEQWTSFNRDGSVNHRYVEWVQHKTCPGCGLVDKRYLTRDRP